MRWARAWRGKGRLQRKRREGGFKEEREGKQKEPPEGK